MSGPVSPFAKPRGRGAKRPPLPQVRVVATADRGLGVFTDSPIRAGRAVGRVLGKIHPAGYSSEYCVEFRDGALEPDEPFRRLNHSCAPNCEFIEWTTSADGAEESELWLHALRDVAAGEELTIDYGWDADAAIPCRCGAPNCR
ncbi:MAG: SET domain-containing protein-lysine N-methyltransferase, partial [Thermoguttaceae bacterium]|nr:SET domain-containing protein-lysine N-methyltransferase [Thermoguttaceae bacterium]